MKIFCFLLLTALLQLSLANPLEHASLITNPYILNGKETEKGEFPHQLMLQRRSQGVFSFICGAVLINKHQAFTAAHCVDGTQAKDLRVVAGLHHKLELNDTQTILIKKVIAHPKYNDGTATFNDDFAILNFEKPVKFNSEIQPIAWNDNENITFAQERCVLSGWGRTEGFGTPLTLQKVTIKVISNRECDLKTSATAVIYPGHICALESNYGSCSGDSGGPMTCEHKGKKVLAGVTSWGTMGLGGCNPNFPSVYARTSFFKDFINKNLIK